MYAGSSADQIYWAMLVQEYGKPVLGRMHCDNSGERFMDTLVRLTGCAAHVDLMAFWCRQLLRHGYVYRRYRWVAVALAGPPQLPGPLNP